MQQQQPQMLLHLSSYPPPTITTDQIQKYLDDNKKLILAILDNQNLGKLAECAQYQALLQKNLMYLAAIADAQPQALAMPSQMTPPPHPAMQQGGFYIHQSQAAAAMAQQAGEGLFPQQKGMPLLQQQLFNSPHPLQEHQQQLLHQHQQAIQGQLGGGGIRPGVGAGGGGTINGMQPSSHTEASLAVDSGGGRHPSKRLDASGARRGGGGDDGSHKKGSDEAK